MFSIATSILLVLSLAMACIFGPRAWAYAWGPALIPMAAALGCAAMAHARANRNVIDRGVLVLGMLTTLWFIARACTSPVPELAQADLLLLASAVGSFLCARAIALNPKAETLFHWGLATLLAASVVIIWYQCSDRSITHFRLRNHGFPSGFFQHYNDGANFLIGAAFLLLGTALLARMKVAPRIILTAIATAGMIGIYFTRSRGGVFGMVVATVCFATIFLISGARTKAKWFPIAIIAAPVFAVISGILLFFLWEKTIDYRSSGQGSIDRMLGEYTRLREHDIAIDAWLQNPIAGGGSRSYTWQSFELWDAHIHGNPPEGQPPEAHNDFLMAATGYGLIGASLLIGLLGWLCIAVVWNTRFAEDGHHPAEPHASRMADGLRVGGFAAFAGMFIQSNFSFVFHLLPGAMLLGLAMARMAEPAIANAPSRTTPKWTLAILCALLGAAIIHPSIMATRATIAVLPIYFKVGDAPDTRETLDRYSAALDVWPDSELYYRRAMLHQQLALESPRTPDLPMLRLALRDHQLAEQHHPKMATHPVNIAILHSTLNEPDEAEAAFARAIQRQGGAEFIFRAHANHAWHHHNRGMQFWDAQDLPAAVESFKNASAEVESARAASPWHGRYFRELDAHVHGRLGLALEAIGDLQAAYDALKIATDSPAGNPLQYHAGRILNQLAMDEWYARKPLVAAPMFSEARQRLQIARNHLPPGITAEDCNARISQIDEILRLFRKTGFIE